MASNTAVSDAGSHGDPKPKAVPDLTVGTTGTPLPAKPVLPVEDIPPHKNIVQIVTYSSRMVDNVSDIVEALNISSSASIKYGTIKGAGSSSIVNENKVNQSDLNYIVTVKVTNETSPIGEKFTFNPIPELENSKFTEVFGSSWHSYHSLSLSLMSAGDCFISGFTEGGEFNAIVSIKVNDKSRISAVKAAAEAEIAIAAAPGLSVETKNSLDRHKSDVWDDTEITISVTWAGGGDLKPADEKWDLKTVVDVATRFPHLVQTCAQRTSAILTRYTSLRSFNEANARNPPDDKFKILDYDLCSLYTQDLFNAFLAYKNLRTELSDMLKSPEQYREREPSSDIPNPIRLNAKEMSEATQMARKAMVQIKDITKALITNPSLADLDENGQQRPVPYAWPGELRKRLPVTASSPSTLFYHTDNPTDPPSRPNNPRASRLRPPRHKLRPPHRPRTRQNQRLGPRRRPRIQPPSRRPPPHPALLGRRQIHRHPLLHSRHRIHLHHHLLLPPRPPNQTPHPRARKPQHKLARHLRARNALETLPWSRLSHRI